jgi:hypothetical protein
VTYNKHIANGSAVSVQIGRISVIRGRCGTSKEILSNS